MKKLLLTILCLSLLLSLSGCYSCESWNDLRGKGPVEPGSEHKFFFHRDCKVVAKAQPKAAPAPKAKPMPRGNCSTVIYPSADCGVLKLEKIMPSQVQMGAPFEYTLRVTNLTNCALLDVEVVDHLQDGLVVSSSSPTGVKRDGKVVWNMNSLGAKQSQTIKVKASASKTGTVGNCATASYLMPACAKAMVVKPALTITKTAPASALICETIPISMTVKNSGSGSANGVKIVDTLPAGLKTVGGSSTINIDVGTLTAGQSKTYKATLKASRTGSYSNQATATAAGGLKASSATTRTVVREPVLTIDMTSTSRQYIGRKVCYTIKVKNTGDAAAGNAVVEASIPSGLTSVRASGGKMSAGKVVWNLGSLGAGASRTFEFCGTANKAGTLSSKATAKAVCAKTVADSAQTSITGIAAILLEVIDTSDPVEVGSNETYRITVTNQGSAPDTNIRIKTMLTDEMQYVRSTGATTGSHSAGVVTFAPLRSLAPKAKTSWTVVVKASDAGKVLFKVTMNSDELGSNTVEETEATNFYE